MDKRLKKKSDGWNETTAVITTAKHHIQQGGRGPSVDYARLTLAYEAANVSYSFEQDFYVKSGEASAIDALPGQTLPLRYNPLDVTEMAVFDEDVRKLCRSLLPPKR